MPGLQGDSVVAALGSPVKRNKLSLKFFQRKETKRALDFSEPPAEEAKVAEAAEEEEVEASGCDQVVPGPCPRPASPGLLLSCEKRESLVPFVGLNNLGNTCYLNSILQVLYYCPGLREGIKRLHTLTKKTEKPSEESEKTEEAEGGAECLPAHLELLGSFNSLITSVEQLQSRFLLDPDSFGEGELATPPRKILHTLRQLNPMYEGFLQHDAQEVLQCILGYIQEACETIRKEREPQEEEEPKAECGGDSKTPLQPPTPQGDKGEEGEGEEEEGQVSGKRKSDTEVGNAKKKPKSAKSQKAEAEEKKEEEEVGSGTTTRSKALTRSKRKSSSSSEVAVSAAQGEEDEEAKKLREAAAEAAAAAASGGEAEKPPKEAEGKRKRRGRLGWPKPSGKQPSIFSKFLSVGKLTTSKLQAKAQEKPEAEPDKKGSEAPTQITSEEEEKPVKQQEGLDLLERMFQGQLVLRTRCLECECFTERREDFQDISVPVLDDQPTSPDDLSEVSPDPKPELKTLTWAIGQFASVERIVGEDKYFCETCHHYTEAERSLLFDKTPEVVTIHLKRFSANSLELDPYGGLSKVNTPLQTPLSLSLEEWCTPPSSSRGQHYQLFAVVMHSGVTISSGHYTAYVRVSGLRRAKLWPRGDDEEAEAAAAAAEDYDDGEVSFSVSRQRSVLAAKKADGGGGGGGVGLLGGQRSFSSCELGAGKAADGSKRRKTISAEVKKEEGGETAAAATEQQALGNLLEYEGKWLLFDDSEVRLLEEEEFLQACSPHTCSAATPYLLFYRRVPKH